MTQAEKFCKLNGIPIRDNVYWMFQDAKSILEVMMKRDDWDYFIQVISGRVPSLGWHYWVRNPDKLLDEAIKWCEHEKTTT